MSQAMDFLNNLQDVIRCHVCETPVPSIHCDICHINLCIDCKENHLSDKSKEHKLVAFAMRGSTPKCLTHSPEMCELYCEQCNVPLCAVCVSLGEHAQHKTVDIPKTLAEKKKIIQKDLQELENYDFMKCQEAESNIPVQKVDLYNEFQKLSVDLNKEKEDLHREIDIIFQKMQSKIDSKCKAIHELSQHIVDLKKLLDSNDVRLLSRYKSRNDEFRKCHAQLKTILPNFIQQKINREQLYQEFNSLSETFKIFPIRPFIDEPQIIEDINTEYGGVSNELHNMSCLSENEFWTCGYKDIMRLYNLKGEILREVRTSTNNCPQDISVMEGGNLLYTDDSDRSINIESNTEMKTLLKLQGWIPHGLCISFSGDYLVSMTSDDWDETKVVRYSGSTEKQSIQWDDKGEPLYSSGYITLYLTENRNLDICVADPEANAVVVVSAAGKLHFRYTDSPTTLEEPFYPRGITTDNQCRILIADFCNQIIHILDENGYFLRFIKNCNLRSPRGLCVDRRDNLYVAESYLGNVKKIQYYK